MPDARLAALLDQIDRAFDRPSWHGPNLAGSIRGLTEEAAAWRPGPDRHNAWEIIVHAAYWKYRVLRTLDPEAPRSFGERGSNFFLRPGDGARLADDVERLHEWHRRLRTAAEGIDPTRLDQNAKKGTTVAEALAGIAAHDVYHAGQIRLLRRLQDDV